MVLKDLSTGKQYYTKNHYRDKLKDIIEFAKSSDDAGDLVYMLFEAKYIGFDNAHELFLQKYYARQRQRELEDE